MKLSTICAALAFALAAGVVHTETAHADASCTALVTSMTNTLKQSGGYYMFDMTMHRTDVAFVSYSSGSVGLLNNTSWPLYGTSNQLFSDRYNGSQPFNINAADQLQVWIGSTGSLYIYYKPWNFATNWDMSCSSTTITRNLPGVGVVTLTFHWYPPIG